MFTVKLIQQTDERLLEEVFSCDSYKRDKENNRDCLTLYEGDTTTIIELDDPPEDKHGVYETDVYIMNNNGKTIDRY